MVGTPKGRLSKLEADLLERPWQNVRPGVEAKVLPHENELYVSQRGRMRVAMINWPETHVDAIEREHP